MKLISKLEDFINMLILKFFALLKKLIPSSLVEKHKKAKLKSKHLVKRNKVVLLRKLKKLHTLIHYYNNLFFTKADYFKTYPFKERFEEVKLNLRMYFSSKTRF
jgi:hypothetical protein